MSEDLNEQVVVAFFESPEKADAAADSLMNWDKANDDIKLGTMGRVTHGAEGKVETKHYHNTRSRRGALIGGAVGLVAAGVTGGLSLLVGAVGGGVLGGVAGRAGTDHLGMSDGSLQKLEDQLAPEGSALVVLCDDHELNATVA
ncbi:MAG: hypothetical protein HC802_19615, partial [Caldilineaceae bacterium]|nr:hypothetical protein [Caldilineaceae bacterium]